MGLTVSPGPKLPIRKKIYDKIYFVRYRAKSHIPFVSSTRSGQSVRVSEWAFLRDVYLITFPMFIEATIFLCEHMKICALRMWQAQVLFSFQLTLVIKCNQ